MALGCSRDETPRNVMLAVGVRGMQSWNIQGYTQGLGQGYIRVRSSWNNWMMELLFSLKKVEYT